MYCFCKWMNMCWCSLCCDDEIEATVPGLTVSYSAHYYCSGELATEQCSEIKLLTFCIISSVRMLQLHTPCCLEVPRAQSD